MKTKKLMMPLAFLFGVLCSLNSLAAVNKYSSTTSGIPFTVKYLMDHHVQIKTNNFYSAGGVYMYMGATQAGLYTDWTITVSNSNYYYTWRTTDSSQGSIDNYQSNYYAFTSYTGVNAIPPGIYTVSVQCNQSGAWRDDIGVTGDNDTGRWVQDYNAYDQAYVVENVEITANGEGVWIGTTTNY